MRNFRKRLAASCALALTGFACGAMNATARMADDGKDAPPAKTETKRIDAPVPGLTERERWMLERMEQLEKRVAELEAKAQPAASSSSEAIASQPAAAAPATAQPGPEAPAASSSVASLVPSAALSATAI